MKEKQEMRSNTEKNEQKIKNQEKEIQRKLNQLQLEELTKRNKKIIQAPIKKEESEKKTAAVPPNAHHIPVPIINVYTQHPEQMGW